MSVLAAFPTVEPLKMVLAPPLVTSCYGKLGEVEEEEGGGLESKCKDAFAVCAQGNALFLTLLAP